MTLRSDFPNAAKFLCGLCVIINASCRVLLSSKSFCDFFFFFDWLGCGQQTENVWTNNSSHSV